MYQNGIFYFYNDQLGSVTSMSNANNGVAVTGTISRYLPFGDWRTEPTAGLTDEGYTGHKHNNLGGGADDLGLIYMNARYYVPNIGRFASADTIVPDPANPQNYNRYSYVNNNPMGYVDSSGHAAEQTNEADSCDVLVCGLNPYEQTGDPYGDFTYEQTILLQLLWLDTRGISDEPLRLGLTFDLSFLARAEYAEYGAAATLYATSPSTFKGSVLENLIDPDLLVGVAYGIGAIIGGGPGSGGNDDVNVAFGADDLIEGASSGRRTIGVDDLMEGATPGPKTKGRSTIWNKNGGLTQAESDFNALSLNDITDIPGVGTRGTLSNGDTVVLRPTSNSGMPTLEIQSGGRYTKYRYGP